ncbi:hypothetical protein [Lysobacter tyrosinilyticus]
MSSHDLPWSAEQREWLQALGHDVLMLASTTAAEPQPELREAVAPASKPETGARPAAASPLLRALARAAGRSEQDADLLQVLPDLATLRGSPAARRALWPHLRALRKRTAR